jgi:hypothetical protein
MRPPFVNKVLGRTHSYTVVGEWHAYWNATGGLSYTRGATSSIATGHSTAVAQQYQAGSSRARSHYVWGNDGNLTQNRQVEYSYCRPRGWQYQNINTTAKVSNPPLPGPMPLPPSAVCYNPKTAP